MRTTFLAILFALVASCATADQIDNAITNLPDAWTDDATGPIIMPQTASVEDVLRSVFAKWWFPTNEPPTKYSQITNFTVLKTRQVSIPCCHFSGAHAYPYTAVVVQTNLGEKIVFLKYVDVYTSRAWWSSEVFDAKPSA